MTRTKSTYLALVAVLLTPMAAQAVVISYTDSGWYDDTGFHNPSNQNYIAGLCSACGGGGAVFRNWFVFDLTGVGTAISAVLRLDTSTVETGGTYSLWDVLTGVGTLTAGGSGLTGIFDDLGMGDMFGSIAITADQDNEIIEIALSSAALASINAADGLWAIGGSYESDLSTYFGSDFSRLTRELVINVSAPEPGTCQQP